MLLASTSAALASPANDNFSSATNLGSGMSVTFSGSNVGATGQSGEPNHANNAFGPGCTGPLSPNNGCESSVWWNWTAPGSTDGVVTIDTCASDFDTVLAVYKTTPGLTLEAQDDNAPPGVCPVNTQASWIRFLATHGIVNHIAVAGAQAVTGNISGELSETTATPVTPAGGGPGSSNNDVLANAATILPAGGSFTGSSVGATGESGEPNHGVSVADTSLAPGCTNATTPTAGCMASVWWKYTPVFAPSSNTGPVTINTCGSSFPTILTVYTDAASNPATTAGLKEVASNAIAPPGACSMGGNASQVTFTATNNVAYYIAVSGEDAASGSILGNVANPGGTASAPVITYPSPAGTSITSTTATLNGFVNPEGQTTAYHFDYGTSTTYGTMVPGPDGSAGSGSTNQAESAAITGLVPATTYHFRLDAGNSSAPFAANETGGTSGADQTFTTLSGPPGASTQAASSITGTGATLNGSVTPNGADTTYTFDYGTTTAYGNQSPTPAGDAGSAGNSTAVSESTALTGLTPGTSYHYRVEATNSNGTTLGPDQTFTTSVVAPVVATSAATSVGGMTATLNGTVNPGGGATTYTFDYGTTTAYGSQIPMPSGSAGSGNSPVSESASPTGLTPNTTYHFRIEATNSNTTTLGSDQTFTTSPVAPAVTTGSASSITGSAATLNGTVNPERQDTMYHFEYGKTTAYELGPTTATDAGSGSTDAPASAGISSLQAGTTYHFRLVAVNGSGTTDGADQSFTTLPPPTATTDPATGVSSTAATLNATINPNGSSTTYHFEYGTSTAYGTTVPSPDGSAGSGTSNTTVASTIIRLTPGTTYHYRIDATNANGTTNGSDRTLTAADRPTVTTDAATSITSTGATVNGTVNPNSATVSSTYHFDYGTSTAYGTSVPVPDGSVGTGTSAVPESADLSGQLLPGTTYHFRLVAANSSGTTNGPDRSFTTPPVAPIVATQAASSVSGTSATLNGTVTPGGAATTYTFDYGTTTAYGSQIPSPSSSAGSGNSPVSESATPSGLMPGTTYHYRIEATNSVGTTFGSDQMFTTPAISPAVSSQAASSVRGSGATLNGTVTPNGSATTYTFDYGTSAAYGNQIPSPGGDAGSGDSPVTETANLTGLTPGTTYHYRIEATNAQGTTLGSDQTFTTLSLPGATTGAASSVAGTAATLNGSVNPEGQAATYHFEYGTSTAYGTSLPVPDASAGSGSSAMAETAGLTGLSPGTVYHFRLVATNATGTTDGADQTFTTLSPPAVVTSAPSSVTGTGGTLNGSVNPQGQSVTDCHFEWGPDTSYGNSVPCGSSPGSGSSPVSVAADLAELTPGTTYHYRLVATNGTGTTNGTDQTLTTLSLPGSTTGAASSVSGSGATLNGTVNPQGQTSTYHFEYGTTTAYGTSAPAPDASAGSGSSDTPVSINLTGLTPGTTYHFRLVTTNGTGTSNGADHTFTTLSPPAVTTGAASSITGTAATLNASVNPEGQSTTDCHFEYGPTTSYGSQAACASSPGSGSSAAAVTANLTGLTPSTTYHVRIVAANGTGSTPGTDQTFTTLSFPSATTAAASSVTGSAATLNGTVNPQGQATTYHFEYGTTTGYGTSAPAPDASAGSGSSNTALSLNLAGLTPSTTYHFRLVATNGTGTTNGADQTFTTLSLPSATTGSASSVAGSSATLNGTVNPQGQATTYHFEYGATTAYGSSAPAPDASAGSGSSDTAATTNLTGLTPGTTYHYRLVATNGTGTTNGADQTFTTPPLPSATTGSTSSVTGTTSTLNGTVNPQGQATTYHFEYGTTTAYGSSAPAPDASAGSGSTDAPVSTDLSGLTPGTTYHYRLVATNASGTANGPDQTFTTQGPPVIATGAATSIGTTTATLNGTVNPNGSDTQYLFQYGTTTAYASRTTVASAGSGSSAGPVSASLTGLTAGTTYHFRIIASNAGGPTFGTDVTFTTKVAPLIVRLRLGKTLTAKNGAVSVPVLCASAAGGTCKVTLTITGRAGKQTIPIGNATGGVPAGRQASLKVLLTAAAQQALAADKQLNIQVKLRGTDTAGHVSNRSRLVTLQ